MRSNFFVKVKTATALGIVNIGRILWYRLGLAIGFNPVKGLDANIEQGVFFCEPLGSYDADLKANDQWLNKQTYFGRQFNNSSEVPNWHQSCLTGVMVKQPLLPWWVIADFDDELGDIKGVWEVSRFDWVLSFSQQAVLGDKESLFKLNDWLNDWLKNNPPYLGINWKCGQEASIRVMHLAMASVIMGQHKCTTKTLLDFIKAHLARIAPTISYAIAQDNNHGTSEAAALFIGGSWLLENGDGDGEKWCRQGRKWLANRAEHLIEADGSFSQYSTTYHRLMLDTYSMAEIWRKSLDLPLFDGIIYTRLDVATDWLFNMTQFETGDAPNLGANDGARLLPLTGGDYRDFRPSVQLASALFLKKTAYNKEGDWDQPLKWLRIQKPSLSIKKATSLDMPLGGYGLLRNKGAFVLLNYPKFRFRPSQCDALHVDFWLAGENLLRDAGTFSYNAGQEVIDYYGGTQSHNTAQFDEHQQMPRLSRFLLGDWLKTGFKQELKVEASEASIATRYKDRFNCQHIRAVKLTGQSLLVEDQLSGFKRRAVARWRLSPGNWRINGHQISSDEYVIAVESDVEISRLELIEGRESRYYYLEETVPVIEIEINKLGIIKTEFRFKK